MAYTVEVIRSSRKSLSLELRPDGTVVVRAPMRTGMPQIRAFVDRHRDWIEKRLCRQARTQQIVKLSDEELAALKKAGKQRFAERAAHFASLLGVQYGRIAVRCQKSKWGSCSAKGNLNFNCLLLLAPQEVLDYVVVHELCHLREMNHSARFWQYVAAVIPDHRERRRWLREHGAELMARVY